MRRWLAWAQRDLLNAPRFVVFFVLNAAFALSGVIAIQSVDHALALKIEEQSAQILGADLTLSARRFVTAEERAPLEAMLPAAHATDRLWEFFSMMSFRESSRLISVKAIDEGYPLHGEITLAAKDGDGALSPVNGEPGLWVPPEVLAQNELKLGDEVRLGGTPFRIRGVIGEDTTQGFRVSLMAARVYAARPVIEASGLFSKGTTFTETLSYRWEGEPSPDEVTRRFFRENQDATLRVETIASARRDFARPLQYLSDYLGLVSVAALSLGFLGLSYLTRSFLLERRTTLALWKVLGMARGSIIAVFGIQFVLLGVLATLVASLLARGYLQVLGYSLNAFLSRPLDFVLDYPSIGFAFVVVLLSILAAALPPAIALTGTWPGELLSRARSARPRPREFWQALPMAAVLAAIAVHFGKSYRVGLGFIGAMLAVILVFAIIAWGALRLFRAWSFHDWRWVHVQRYLVRNVLIVSVHLVTLGLGAVLLGMFPHLKAGIERGFSRPDVTKVPGIFLFDIQDEQLAGVQQTVAARGLALNQLSPMVRARILAVNGVDYERPLNDRENLSREEEEEARSRNRGVNLTFRADLADGDRITAGEPFQGVYDAASGKPFEVSVEERYATRMKIGLGDAIKFDVQGVEFEGRVSQLRSVNWARFQPNFFIVLQPGVVDDAPKTWLAGISVKDERQKLDVIAALGRVFPNVSALDVRQTVDRLMETADQMLSSLNLMFVLLFIVGSLVLGTVIQNQAERRVWDLNLFRVVGAADRDTRGLLRREFIVLGAFAGLTASALSVGVAYLVGEYVFEEMFAFDPAGFFLTVAIVLGLSVLIGAVVARGIFRRSAQTLLRGQLR